MPDTPGPGPLPYDPPKWDGVNAGAEPQVWENPMWTPGQTGINPSVAADKLQPTEALRRVNLVQRREGGLEVRPGQSLTTTAAGGITAVEELDNPQASSYERYAMGGTNLYRGGTVIDGSYSGTPPTLLPFRPQLSGQPWMVVADTAKIRQVPFGGSPIPLGIAPPTVAAAPEIADILTTSIAAFDASDGTVASNWSLNAGTTRPNEDGDVEDSDPPTAADITGISGAAVEFTLVPGGAGSGFYSSVSIAKPMNLNQLQGGGPAYPIPTNDDIIHTWLRCDKPHLLEEIRLYFVCSPSFVYTTIPGTHETENADAFVKTYRPHDFTGFVELLQSGLAAGNVSRDNTVVGDFLNPPEGPPQATELIETIDPYNTSGIDATTTQVTEQLRPGRAAWSEFGSIGRPVRRGEFMRIGGTEDVGWQNVTGIFIVIVTNTNEEVKVACDDWFLTGGYALDSSPATNTAYDYRYTNYHTVTGDEGNPSPEQAPATFVEALRQRLKQTPPPYGDAAVVQRFYRRGGSLPDNWYFVGDNGADGAEFVDEIGDLAAAAADTVETDNDQPISTFTDAGVTVLAQPVPVMFGPINGVLFACGDPYRPGHLYRSKAGRPGSWPPDFVTEVVAPSELLIDGVELNGGGILWSRLRAFNVLPNISQDGDTATSEIPGAPGLAQRKAWAKRDGVVYYVARSGIYRTGGSTPEEVTKKLRVLFEASEGTFNPLYPPIDWDAGAGHIRLECYQHQLHFVYTATDATRWYWIIDLLRDELSVHVFQNGVSCPHMDEGQQAVRAPSLIQGGSSGNLYTWGGFTDAGTAIPYLVQTGYLDAGRAREDKLLGDVVMDVAGTGTLSLQILLNNGDVTNTAMTVAGVATRTRFTFDPFGIVPQFARNLSFIISSTAPTDSRPIIYLLGASWASLPDQTMKRATQWQPLGISEQFVKGCTIVCETGDVPITVYAEGTRTGLGDPFLMDTLTVRANGKRVLQFSWATMRAEQVRIRPVTDCGPWRLFRIDWDHTPEPPRVGFWDTHAEQLGDQYFTGVDLDVNTFGVEKQVQIYVDNILLVDPVSSTTNFTLSAVDGRRWVHLTFNALVPIRGHVVRITSIDGVLGMLFAWKWQAQAEPSEQTNWNQNYSIEAAMNDKSIKGVILECDTFGQEKSIRIEVDQVLHTLLPVIADGRSVVNLTWQKTLGRVLRLYPVDNFPGRLYGDPQWIFDEEPYQLQLWQTQRIDFGLRGRKAVWRLEVAYRSEFPVDFTMRYYNTAGVLLGTQLYTLPETDGEKAIKHVRFQSNAGWLYEFDWSVDDAEGFALYRPETRLDVLPQGGELQTVNPFGDDDLDKVRSLSRARDIATASGGIRQ